MNKKNTGTMYKFLRRKEAGRKSCEPASADGVSWKNMTPTQTSRFGHMTV